MQRFLFILQILIKCTLLFLISFIWLRFLTSSIWVSGAIAFVITLIIEFFSMYFKRKNKYKTNLKIKEKENAENMFLSLSTDKNFLSFFHNLSLSRHSNCQRKKDYIIINHSKSRVILFPFIKIKKLSPDDLLEIYKKCNHENATKIVIVCNEYEKDCSVFIKNFSIKFLLLDKFETYSMLYKEYDFYPEITLEYKKEAKPTLKDLLAYSFNKSRTKGYLLSALLLFITSFFVKINLYYCIISSALLLFALISFINPKYNIKKERTIL